MQLTSTVPGFEGPCKATWLNKNIVSNRFDRGVTGFFKRTRPVLFGLFNVKTGREFHGIIRNGIVETTGGL